MNRTSDKHSPGGRPPKFREPRRPVTVTLPERILRQLYTIDHDRARAIVKATETVLGLNDAASKPVELVEIEAGKAVIVVGACPSLQQIPWLRLVRIAPGRNLLIIPTGKAVESLEVAILDLIEHEPALDERECSLLKELRNELCRLRRKDRISKAEIILFDVSGAERQHDSRQGSA
jgi:hypothetical protein